MKSIISLFVLLGFLKAFGQQIPPAPNGYLRATIFNESNGCTQDPEYTNFYPIGSCFGKMLVEYSREDKVFTTTQCEDEHCSRNCKSEKIPEGCNPAKGQLSEWTADMISKVGYGLMVFGFNSSDCDEAFFSSIIIGYNVFNCASGGFMSGKVGCNGNNTVVEYICDNYDCSAPCLTKNYNLPYCNHVSETSSYMYISCVQKQ